MNDAVASAAKSAPSVSVTAAWLAGIDLPHIVMGLTALYTGLQIVWFVYEKVIKK
jgi:hypothetical protein